MGTVRITVTTTVIHFTTIYNLFRKTNYEQRFTEIPFASILIVPVQTMLTSDAVFVKPVLQAH